MGAKEDIAKIAEQEAALVFDAFDEAAAFALGSAIRERALRETLPVVIDIRAWDRPLFFCSLPGATAANANWARRKINTVRMFSRSTYRLTLEHGRTAEQMLEPRHGLDVADYVLAGGGFPVRARNAGVIGAVAVSGLPQRQDHELVVAALCAHLGRDAEELALGEE